MSRKSSLGRGLSDLIPDRIASADENVSKLIYLDVEHIIANANQPRKNFDEIKLQELADSIKANGLIQPIIVRDLKSGKFEIIAGERRWRASIKAGLKKIPAIINEFSEENISLISLTENLQRENLNPIEEAQAYQKLLSDYGLTQDQLAIKIGKSRSQIANICRLLNLPEVIQQYLINGMISIGHARTLLTLEDVTAQLNLCEEIIEQGLSVRQIEEIIKQSKVIPEIETINNNVNNNKKKLSRQHIQTYLDIEEKMRNIFGTHVKIKNKAAGKGKIEIEYYSDTDLERILEIMNLSEEKF